MTSSGTYAFSPSNGELVLAAYERIQIRAPAIRQEHMLSARRELNFLFSEMSNKSPNLWEITLVSQMLTPGTATYSVNADTIMILDAVITLNQGSRTSPTSTSPRSAAPSICRIRRSLRLAARLSTGSTG